MVKLSLYILHYLLERDNSYLYNPKVLERDHLLEQTLSSIQNSDIKTVGPELVFGKIYNAIGFDQIEEPLFRHLVISRLAFPLSKLKTVEFLQRFQGVKINIDSVYRFLDKLNHFSRTTVKDIKHFFRCRRFNICPP